MLYEKYTKEKMSKMLKKNRATIIRVTDQSSKEQTIAKCTVARYVQ